MANNTCAVLRAVGAVGQRVRRAASRQHLIDEILGGLVPAMGASCGGVYLFMGQSLEVFSRGVAERHVAKYLDLGALSDPLVAYTRQHHAPVHEQCLFTHAEWREHPLFVTTADPAGLQHYLVSPVIGRREIVGALSLARTSREGPFTELELCGSAVAAMQTSMAFACMTGESDEAADALRTLSARERQVMELAARGLLNAEIAALLSVSHNTVKKHLKAVFAKLSVSRRSELAWLVGLAAGRTA